MLSFLKIKNFALIDELEIEFGEGLNLLTGETGSGKSIIVDALGALTGERVYAELIKQGEHTASIEGVFKMRLSGELRKLFDDGGFENEDANHSEIIIRREMSREGRNRIYLNNQLVTQNFLKNIGAYLVDIHGQGEQTDVLSPSSHLEMLDEYALLQAERKTLAEKFAEVSDVRSELESLRADEAQKLQLIDILKFQVDEIGRAKIVVGEDNELEEEKRRLNNVEKLSALSEEAFGLLYENSESTSATLQKGSERIERLGEFEKQFQGFIEGLNSAKSVIEDAAIALRNFRSRLEFSPARLEDIESRLAELSHLKRKYGGTIEAVLQHYAASTERLQNIETAELREKELGSRLEILGTEFVKIASDVHEKRVKAARKFEREVEANLKTVALEKARFEVRIDSPSWAEPGAAATGLSQDDKQHSDFALTNVRASAFTARGFDSIEFFFSANPGEALRPLARVASGGEASRLMLILKTTAKFKGVEKAVVFDEIDIGIGGRVAEAVGRRLKQLSATQQVLCVTHQPQIASLADRHFVVEKETGRNRTRITVRGLDNKERVEEIARMLAGEKISDAARENARAMLASG